MYDIPHGIASKGCYELGNGNGIGFNVSSFAETRTPFWRKRERIACPENQHHPIPHQLAIIILIN